MVSGDKGSARAKLLCAEAFAGAFGWRLIFQQDLDDLGSFTEANERGKRRGEEVYRLAIGSSTKALRSAGI
jgi:hypothetical protein